MGGAGASARALRSEVKRVHFAAAFAKSPALTKLIFASEMCLTSAALISAGVRPATIDSSSASQASVRLMYETVFSRPASERPARA